MDLSWATIEDLARTSDEAAVRRKYDRRNFVWLIVHMIFFVIVSFLEIVTEHRNTMVDVLIGSGHLAFSGLGLYALWHRRSREWIRRRIPALVIFCTAVHFAFVLAFTFGENNWMAWVTTVPWMMLAFRMSAVEHVLLHSLLATGGLVVALLSPASVSKERGTYVSILAINAVTLGLELFFSRRLRKQVATEWSERRVHAREQIRMRDELHYARELQLSMLPECAPSLDWLDLCAISIPATEVGGDYYDYFVEDDRVALVCGDVAGHGMASGLVLAGLRSGFTLLRDALHDPAAVLRRLHDLVTQTSRRRMLVTVSVVLLDRRARRAILASAGHPPVILRHADGTVETIDLYAPPLGVRLPVDIPQRTLDFARDDVFVLHSDGIYETRSAAGEDYGLDRLTSVVRTQGGGTAEQLRDAILADVAAFRGSSEAADDVTIVVGRVLE
ncbi:MAG: PP2C family protein-serine/threonine phosphatase [Acidobacteriota bacterium]